METVCDPRNIAARDPAATIESTVLLGESAAARRLRSQVRRIGPYFRTALLTGEPGTGMEMVARALHRLSAGSDGAFIMCDARSLACRNVRQGLSVVPDSSWRDMLRSAEDGALFVHHLGSMTAEAQIGFMQTLEHASQARTRTGADGRLAVRIIAATDRNLRTMTMAGQFRADLYERISTVEMALPTLRARAEDISAIAGQMVRLAGGTAGISAAATEALQGYAWPGNIDELEAVLREAVVAATGGPVEVVHIQERVPGDRRAPATGQPGKIDRLQTVIERYVMEVLTTCGGNKLRTAELLGISRSTLYRMLESSTSEPGLAVPAVQAR